MINIAIFGGSFNPFHQGHLFVCNKLLKLGFDKVFIMPTKINPLKTHIPTPSLTARLLACKQALQNNPKLKVCDYEKLSPSNNTAIVMKEVKKRYSKHYNITFAMGQDNLLTIHKWPFYLRLVDGFNIVIISRGSDVMQKIKYTKTPFAIRFKNNIITNKSCKSNGIRYLYCSSPDVSSSKIRSSICKM